MKTLVVYYSRTGTTQRLAKTLAEKLKADICEIEDLKDRKGVLGFMMAGKDATFKSLTNIKNIKIDIAGYDLVVVGTPVWSGNMAPAVRTFLTNYKDDLKDVAFFATQGMAGSEKAFKEMDEVSGKDSKDTLVLSTKEVLAGNYDDKIENFIKVLS